MEARCHPAVRSPIALGRPYPLGAMYDGYGTNFAVYSSIAERVIRIDTAA